MATERRRTRTTPAPAEHDPAPPAEGGRPLEMLTLDEVCRCLKISRAQGYRLLKSGDLEPGILLGTRKAAAAGTEPQLMRWFPADLEAFLRREPRARVPGKQT